jgi:spore germination protein GerM
MAGRKTGGTKRKPAAKKTNLKSTNAKTRKPSAGTRSKKTLKNKSDKTPIYVLAIMALLTVIIIMLINNYNAGKKIEINDDGNKKESIVKKETEPKKIKNELAKEIAKEIAKEKVTKEEVTKETKNSKEKIVTDKPDKKETPHSEFLIYLVRFNENGNRMSLLPVKRNIKAESPLKDTLNELIKGPNKTEKKKGLLTAIPDDLRLRNVQVVGKNAVLDFNEAIETNANGEILLTRIDQLVYTATQFEGVEGVIIKVNGKQKRFLGGDGLSVSGPIGRREK